MAKFKTWRERPCACGCGKRVEQRIQIDMAYAIGHFDAALLKNFGWKRVRKA